MKEVTVYRVKKLVKVLPFYLVAFWLITACSEDTGEVDDYANWEERNEVYFASLTDSLRNDPIHWSRIKSFSLDSQTEGAATDYIYVKTIASGEGSESPLYTDSVRVSYQGRVIPTVSYPQGYVFDGTVYGDYSLATNATTRMKISSLIIGMQTALLHMHRGDYWRVYIPNELGYKSQDQTNSGIPPYSTLIFDLTLIDFSPVGESMPVWSARPVNWKE
ncbi:MAG: FKBP-type peptidyl-prolyl cis-trans isomerase [Prevotella sp.]|nr:FKBP-type peptidyl-prolyl cis-trans isomerase [Prevotella sp.]